MADAYSSDALMPIAKVIVDREGSVNMVKADLDWREIYPHSEYPGRPSADAWIHAFKSLGLVEDVRDTPWN